jgi:hypothetical protein
VRHKPLAQHLRFLEGRPLMLCDTCQKEETAWGRCWGCTDRISRENDKREREERNARRREQAAARPKGGRR